LPGGPHSRARSGVSANGIVNAALELLKRLGPARLAAMIAVTLALVGFFAFVITRFSQPGMAVLYSDLSFQDASNIIRELETKGVTYQTRADGQTILAPKDVVGKLRMEFASKGMPTGGGVGYEIFDKGDAFSSTSFVQNINQLRAMEGELARTIQSLARVQSARVHLVIPERKLFERDREAPSASIVMRLSGDLDMSQVQAIRHLVASAVEGLKPEKISIVDERGRLLADGARPDDARLSLGLDERQTAVERRLRQQVKDIVTGVVGEGRVRVEVAADMDFNRIENRSETFDPESRVVRSTQTRSENQQTNEPREAVSVGNELPAANLQQQGQQNNQQNQTTKDTSSKNEEVTNYEISKSTRTEVIEGGRLKRISVAVVVDGNYAKGPDGKTTYQPRNQEELDRITALVRTAIGFDQKRGDQLEVVNLRFAEPPPVAEEKPTSFLDQLFSFDKYDLMRMAEMAVLGLLSLIVMLTVVRPLVKRVLAPDPAAQASLGPRGTPQLAGPDGQIPASFESLQIGSQFKSIDGVGELVKNNPQETASILRQWIHENA
jgi:flagellar M-ring protein FliF